MLCPTGTAPAVQLVRIVPTTKSETVHRFFSALPANRHVFWHKLELELFFNLNYSDYTEIHLLKRDETLALINDASTDLSLYESRAGGPNIANNAPAAEMSLYASTVPAADASNVSLMGQMAADMQAGELQRQEEAR